MSPRRNSDGRATGAPGSARAADGGPSDGARTIQVALIYRVLPEGAVILCVDRGFLGRADRRIEHAREQSAASFTGLRQELVGTR